MYLFNIKALKQDLLDQKVTARMTLKYFLLVYIVIMGLDTLPVADVSFNGVDTLFGLVAIAVAVSGTLYIFKCNGGDNGKDFFVRYFTMGWVTSVRYFVFTLPLIVILFVFFYSESETTTLQDASIGLLLEIGYFLYFGKHVKDLIETAP